MKNVINNYLPFILNYIFTNNGGVHPLDNAKKISFTISDPLKLFKYMEVLKQLEISEQAKFSPTEQLSIIL